MNENTEIEEEENGFPCFGIFLAALLGLLLFLSCSITYLIIRMVLGL